MRPRGQFERHHDGRSSPRRAHAGRLRAGQQIAKPLPPLIEERDDDGDHSGKEPDLSNTHQGPDESVPKPDGATVIAHDLQPERHFSNGSTTRHGLHKSRYSDETYDDQQNEERPG